MRRLSWFCPQCHSLERKTHTICGVCLTNRPTGIELHGEKEIYIAEEDREKNQRSVRHAVSEIQSSRKKLIDHEFLERSKYPHKL